MNEEQLKTLLETLEKWRKVNFKYANESDVQTMSGMLDQQYYKGRRDAYKCVIDEIRGIMIDNE